MIGELFTINRDNIVRAAIAEVTKDLASDAPVEATARPHENGIDASILVTSSDGDAYEIVVRESTIADCLQDEDSRAVAQDLVDQLAAEIRHFVDEVLE
ncbi:hypothetical protein [Microbacterium sp. APC 3901]|uniref:hypothetical protein n=1 Tax=Microbacterium sp. APC 3901 TaxID=3035192 RepID=UPI0025B3F2FE|nr:hypothetical protein [Microbacterium sp. APC 3901]MDN3445797.1 hypothetical protein [Microbacterium sp. APC 3901]